MNFEATKLSYKLPQFLYEKQVLVFLLTDLCIVLGNFRRRHNYCPKFVCYLFRSFRVSFECFTYISLSWMKTGLRTKPRNYSETSLAQSETWHSLLVLTIFLTFWDIQWKCRSCFDWNATNYSEKRQWIVLAVMW